MTVTVLLVAHDGARWLPAVLEGLRLQRHRPDRVLAVDTGSSDDSASLLVDALGAEEVLLHDGSFPEAVAHALPLIDTDWVWILHDDANPDPDALGALLEGATRHDAAVAGPKLREWPSLLRLLELGVTISGTGRRETGLERGEYDQGQHDKVREVLAVNTAGMLVRREVLAALGGFDRRLPLYGNDIDFGWRAARAGHRTVVVPQARVFHAEAAHRGVRRAAHTGRRARTHRAEREAALFTLLANIDSRALPWQAVRLFLGSLLRVLGFLLARSPGHAGDELVALLEVYGRPGRILRARRERKATHGDDPADVRRLLAPWWVPYRHGLDLVTDLAGAAASQGRDAAERRRRARAAETGPVPDEAEELAADSGVLARMLTNPAALVAIVLGLLALWGAREAFGPIAGGALSPAPSAAGDWWRLLFEGWHELGPGTSAPAPEYLLPLALLGSALLGDAAAAVSVLFVLAVPAAAWGAWRFLKVAAELGSSREWSSWAVGWGALAYAAVPVASGAWGQGRFGIVASAALLPWLAHAALWLVDPSSDRRWRAGWRTALLLAVVTAFTPVAWLFAVLVVLGGLLADRIAGRSRFAGPSGWGPVAVVPLVPVVLLLPGTLGVLDHDVTAIFLEAGRLMPTPGGLDLLAGRLGDPAAPVWLGLLLVVPALAALARPRTRTAVQLAWVLVALAAVLAAVLSRVTVSLPAGETRPGLGFLVLVGQGALVTAVTVAAHGLWSSVAGASFSWRQPMGVVLVAASVVVPLGGLGWWLFAPEDQLDRPAASDVPVYMAQAAEHGAGHGVLLLRGDVGKGLTWQVHRGDGLTLGEDEVLALTGPDEKLTERVTRLVSTPGPEVAQALPGHGLDYVVMPAPADPQVAATLDAAPGLTQASASERTTRAWQLEAGAPADAVAGDGPWWFLPARILQILAIVVVAVLCGPTRSRE